MNESRRYFLTTLGSSAIACGVAGFTAKASASARPDFTLRPREPRIFRALDEAVQALALAIEDMDEMLKLPSRQLDVCGEDLSARDLRSIALSLELLLPLFQAEFHQRYLIHSTPSPLVEKIRVHQEGRPDQDRTIAGMERLTLALRLFTDRLDEIAAWYDQRSSTNFVDNLDKLCHAIPFQLDFICSNTWIATRTGFNEADVLARYENEVR